MTPQHFPEVNCIYKGEGLVEDLPALRKDGNVISRWQPSWDELQRLDNGGAIELTIQGGQPAVALRVV